MTRDELAKLISDQFSAHVFDYSFAAKDALMDALWPVLAQVWEEGANAQLDEMFMNPYRPVINEPGSYPSGEVSA